jgi:hypothetical protein
MDLTTHIESLSWPEAARFVAEVLAASSDPEIPFKVWLSDDLIVDADGSVSYVTPIRLVEDGRRGR